MGILGWGSESSTVRIGLREQNVVAWPLMPAYIGIGVRIDGDQITGLAGSA